ncbi:MAG TPA: cytochrome c [Nitrospiraceae bacterium]|nr:cytochrome c [Nitrospiraceae bacterium]
MPVLNDPQRIEAGLRSYHAMCKTCHSAPGRQPSTIQQGLNPKPPKLDSERVQNRRDEELYWVIKNGIRMTGMPAFGKTHQDEALWSIVAFVRQLPHLQGKDYAAMVQAAGLQTNRSTLTLNITTSTHYS